MRIYFVAISLSLVMIGIVSLAPTSSVKRRSANLLIHLSISWKVKTHTSTTVHQMAVVGALDKKRICQEKTNATILI